MPFFKYKGIEVYYNVIGKGTEHLLFLHGNTASSKMFSFHIKAFKDTYKVILMDFPNNGKSGRKPDLPLNYWHFNAKVGIALCNELKLKKVNIVGTSGGAIIALNMALIRPTLVKRIIADSFSDRFTDDEVIQIQEQRKNAKSQFKFKLFWFFMHGWDWEKVLDIDTQTIERFQKEKKSFFVGDLKEIKTPVLMTASLEDDLISNIDLRMRDLADNLSNSKLVFFPTGTHPAMISNNKEFSELALRFLAD